MIIALRSLTFYTPERFSLITFFPTNNDPWGWTQFRRDKISEKYGLGHGLPDGVESNSFPDGDTQDSGMSHLQGNANGDTGTDCRPSTPDEWREAHAARMVVDGANLVRGNSICHSRSVRLSVPFSVDIFFPSHCSFIQHVYYETDKWWFCLLIFVSSDWVLPDSTRI